MGGALVALDGQDIVDIGLDDLPGGLLLAVQGVGRDDASGQFQLPQQRGHGRDLVSLLGHQRLAQTMTRWRGP